jgi:uncharacterized protein (TIGR02145 family)
MINLLNFDMKKNITISLLALAGIAVIVSNSCKKDNYDLPTVTTTAISSIMISSASCGSNISKDGGTSIDSRGVCWSTDQTPTVADNKTTDGKGIGKFTSIITDLSPNTTYYVRAFATNSEGTGYGNPLSFTTLPENGGTITDIEGNVYYTVTIGTQVWMGENLDVAHYSNGDSIPNIKDNLQWSELATGAYCDYENNPVNSTTYGKLYNFFTIVDSRGVCPTGWHVPLDTEWSTLTEYLGGSDVAGGKIKESGTAHWQNIIAWASNDSYFTALPSGDRAPFGTFYGIGNSAYWWSSTEVSSLNANYHRVTSNDNELESINYQKTMGMSIRCIRD